MSKYFPSTIILRKFPSPKILNPQTNKKFPPSLSTALAIKCTEKNHSNEAHQEFCFQNTELL